MGNSACVLFSSEVRDRSMTVSTEQRAFTRMPFLHTVSWFDGRGESGDATVTDISRSGLSLEAGRYFRPGPVLRLRFADILHNGEPIELDALTVWCCPAANAPHRFRAGLSVVHGEPVTLAKTSLIFHTAVHAYSLKRSA